MVKNKLFTFLLLGLLLISFASALEFDNTYTYDEVTREATFYNTFLGIKTSQIGKARLNTPLNVKVPQGYQKVAEFDLWAYEDYNNALKQFTFEDMKNGRNKINRDYDLKMLEYENVIIQDYYIECSNVWDNTNQTYSNQCLRIPDGTHIEQRKVWTKISPADLKKNDVITIGVFTDVQKGDFVDWIPMIYGEEVGQWATWTEALSVDIEYYGKMDESSGTIEDFVGSNNGTYNGTLYSQTGIINTSIGYDGTNDIVDSGTATNLAMGSNNFSISFWVNPDEFDGNGVISRGGYAEDGWAMRFYTGGNIEWTLNQPGLRQRYQTGGVLSTGSLQHIVITRSGSVSKAYVNGGLVSWSTWSGTGAHNNLIGTDPSYNADRHFLLGLMGGSLEHYDGDIDEVAIWERELTTQEITDLYNGGSGLPYVDEFGSNPPNITLNSPENNINYTTSPLQVNFSCYGSDDINLTSVGFYLNGVLDQLNATGINNTNYEFSKTLTDGNYNWTCEGTDSESQTTSPTERILGIHSVTPNVTINYPTGILDYHLKGDSLVFNWTIEEQGQNLTTHIKNCTYEYNGIITEINNTVCTQTNTTTFLPVEGVYNLTFRVTDEFDFINTSIATWDIKVFEINQTYNNETIEGNLETFLARIRLGAGYSVTGAVLINYNGSENIGQSFISGSDTILRKADFLIPNVEEDTNVTFYWNVTLSDSTNLLLSSQNQTIEELNLDNCSSFTNELLNISVIDEEEQTILPNATIEVAVNIYDQSRTALVLNFSNLYNNINPLSICLNTNLTENTMLSMDTIIRYEEENHANEYYNIINLSLTNETGSQAITLYDLNLNDSTEFQLSFTGADFLPIENALVYVDRQYISENTFKTVELPKTDYNGQSVLHLVRNDVIYNIRITKDGVVLGNFENLVAFCDDFTIGDCNIELNAFDSVESVFNYEEDLGIIYTSPTYNDSTNLVSFNFVTSDGSAKEVLLEVTRNDIFGNRSICNSTLVSSGGTLQCSIDPNLDDSVLQVSVYTDEILTVKGSVELDDDKYGVAGYLIMFVMAIGFIFMFSGSKTGVLVSIGLTFAGSIGMGIISGDLIGVGASGIWLLIIIIIGIYKLNKDKAQ